jgi:hypothetical protein
MVDAALRKASPDGHILKPDGLLAVVGSFRQSVDVASDLAVRKGRSQKQEGREEIAEGYIARSIHHSYWTEGMAA